MSVLRIGIIGTGGIAHSHIRSYLDMPDVEIIGASDIVPGKARAGSSRRRARSLQPLRL